MGFLKGAGKVLGTTAAIGSPLLYMGLQNPAKGARKYLDQIPAYGESAYRPYIQQGQEADPLLRERYGKYLDQEPMGAYGEMANDPTGLINAIMQQYAQSPGSQYQQKQLTQQAQNAARAGGYAGTMGDQRQQAELVQALSSQDMQQWLQNVLGVKGAGLQGQQYLADKGLAGMENFSNRGFAASGALADYLGGAAGQRAGLEFGGKQAQMGNISNLLGSLISAGAGIFGGSMGGKMGGGMAGGMGGGFGGGGSPNYITQQGRPGAPGSFRW